MERISQQQVLRVAQLARIQLSDSEIPAMMRDLNDILAYMEKLNELDTTEVPPTHHIVSLTTPLRDDRIRPPLEVRAAMDNAPSQSNSSFLVPRVV